jgi:hypothetical protein
MVLLDDEIKRLVSIVRHGVAASQVLESAGGWIIRTSSAEIWEIRRS